MKKLIITALLVLSIMPAQAITLPELANYNSYIELPNAMNEKQLMPIDVQVINTGNNTLEIITPIYSYMPVYKNFIITEFVKHYKYDFNSPSIVLELTETNLIDGRNGKVLKQSSHKPPKRVELQQNTYGYLEAMIALGNAQRIGKFTPPAAK
jgi:hypothetical protein|nr:MAG TPA: hypothetical protein [Caudoviricetes sp.]